MVGDEAVMALKPTVTATKGGTQVAYAFTGSSNGLLSSCLESLGEIVRVDTTTNGHSLSVLRNLQGVELNQVDSNAVVHLSQRGETAMMPIVSKNGNVILVGEFDLERAVSA